MKDEKGLIRSLVRVVQVAAFGYLFGVFIYVGMVAQVAVRDVAGGILRFGVAWAIAWGVTELTWLAPAHRRGRFRLVWSVVAVATVCVVISFFRVGLSPLGLSKTRLLVDTVGVAGFVGGFAGMFEPGRP